MTKVKFSTLNGKFVGVECDGHCDYAEEGADIVCAALSSITQTAVLGIMRLVGVNVDYKTDEKKGYLKAIVASNLKESDAHDVDLILRTAYLGASDLYETFSDFITVEVE